jgi:hypothetical protein
LQAQDIRRVLLQELGDQRFAQTHRINVPCGKGERHGQAPLRCHNSTLVLRTAQGLGMKIQCGFCIFNPLLNLSLIINISYLGTRPELIPALQHCQRHVIWRIFLQAASKVITHKESIFSEMSKSPLHTSPKLKYLNIATRQFSHLRIT